MKIVKAPNYVTLTQLPVKLFCIFASLFFFTPVFSNNVNIKESYKDCVAKINDDTLYVENAYILYKWKLNNGEIIPLSIYDKKGKTSQNFSNANSGCILESENNKFLGNKKIRIYKKDKDYKSPAALEIEIINEYQLLSLKRIIRIFPNTPALTFDYSLSYTDLKDINPANLKQLNYQFKDIHWDYSFIEFRDMTDINDNLVFKSHLMPYNQQIKQKGNLAFAKNKNNGFSFFILKEAPNTTSQVNFPGYDFVVSNNSLYIPLSGIEKTNSFNEFIPAYSITFGISDKQTNGRIALRNYLRNSAPDFGKDREMILLNTWGDRGGEEVVNEKFVLAEIKRASQLGITHFQIDAGWQQGNFNKNNFEGDLSQIEKSESELWTLSKERFPNGLKRTVDYAKKMNVILGLWFNPNGNRNFILWEKDAQILIDFYKKYGIKYFKIDGVSLINKESAINFQAMLDRVKQETDGDVFFNLDLTAQIRGGQFSYRYAGNLFMENRYTDWSNYYPFHTLRNAWMLSEFYPAENLQVEFLNNWRNKDKYNQEDKFAPFNYSFEYLFATTMACQPLAWFEASNLPSEADYLKDTIEKYKKVQYDFHNGIILPIGNEPNGCSWTGFQSISQENQDEGYFLIYRENNNSDNHNINSFIAPETNIKLTCICGNGKDQNIKSDGYGNIKFELDKPNSFVLYKYEIGK
ncbi:MAG: alpha-galactosidase [Bacteroidales bacterium]|nr:alpha-galactosidase [Bacteroidales bacterium]